MGVVDTSLPKIRQSDFMKVMTATEASRSFAVVLDEAERGETIVVTRGGKRIAVIGPAPTARRGERTT
jgi:prevent-host-death family protein